MMRTVATIALALMAGMAAVAQAPQPPRADLAPTGTLRAGVNVGNPVLAVKDAKSGELRGVAIDLARELASRLGVPVRMVTYTSAATMADDAPKGQWDVAFLGADPAREANIAFTPAYLELEATYLVPAGSRLRAIQDVDAPGVRIAARPRSAYDLALRRLIKQARLVYPEGSESDLDLLVKGKADVLSGLTQVLTDQAATLPGSRVLEGRFAAAQQAIGVPKARAAAVGYLRALVEDVKASGFVAKAIQRTGAKGATVAPRSP